MAHWYNNEGKLIPDAGVREARKHNLYPSVTSVMKIIDNYGLNKWIKDQGILAALTMPRPEGITDEDFIKLLNEDSQQQANDAADWGTEVHNLIARKLEGEKLC